MFKSSYKLGCSQVRHFYFVPLSRRIYQLALEIRNTFLSFLTSVISFASPTTERTKQSLYGALLMVFRAKESKKASLLEIVVLLTTERHCLKLVLQYFTTLDLTKKNFHGNITGTASYESFTVICNMRKHMLKFFIYVCSTIARIYTVYSSTHKTLQCNMIYNLHAHFIRLHGTS